MRLLLILLLCCGIAFGQDTTKYFKSVDYGWNWQRGKFRSGLILPTDTTNNKLGVAQINSGIYFWNGSKWVISTSTANTIYTSDGTITGDRIVDINGNGFAFINGAVGIGNFYFSPNTTVKKTVKTPTPALNNQYLPISVNNQYASLTGNIIDTLYKPYVDSVVNANVPILTLQDVTNNGNTTTNDIAANNISGKSFIITGTNGNGHIHLRHQSSDATGTGQSTTLFANSNGYLKWKNDGGYYSTLEMNQSADRNYRFQNKSYTLADSTTLADSVAALRTTLNSKGNVSSIATTSPILGGTITTTGTISADTGRGNNQLATGGSLAKVKDSLAAIISTKGTGTVTSIATSTSTGITGGTITTSGTLSIDTTLISTRAWRQKAVDSLNTIIATKGSGTVTSIATGLGLSGGTITTSGTLLVDTASTSILSRQRAATTYAPISINGTVTSVARTNGLGISASVANSTTTPNITIAVDTSDASILSRQRAATTYLPLSGGTLTSRLTGTSLILNKDSLPTVTSKKWALIVDTANGNQISKQAIPTQIDSPWRAWTETLTWTATTAPSGTANNYYRWWQNGKMVHLEIRLNYANTGTAITQVKTNLPAEMPLPSIATNWGVSATNDILYYSTGNHSTTFSGVGNTLFCTILYGSGASSRTDKINMNLVSASSSKYIYKIDYLTD